MKTTKLILGVLSILVVLAFTASYAEEEKAYVPKDDEEIYGTWVNTEYIHRLTSTHPQKILFYPDGRTGGFPRESDTSPVWTTTVTITDKWTDSEGNIWYKNRHKGDWGGVWYALSKISKSGSVYEYINSPAHYPAEIDPNHPAYHIYNRK